MSVEARDRKLEIWYNKVKQGEIKLPRFQRHESWDKKSPIKILKIWRKPTNYFRRKKESYLNR